MMKHLNIISLWVVPSALSLLMTGCGSDSDSYSPGEEPGMSDTGVYFPSSNETEYIRYENDDNTITLTVARENTSGVLTVPIEVLSKTDNISDVPENVVFADGDAETDLTFSYTDMETAPYCELGIAEQYTNPYKIKDGACRISVTVFKPTVIFSNVTYSKEYNTGADYFSGATSQIVQYGNNNLFLWTNFLGSGIDLKFQIDGSFDSQEVKNSYGEIIPVNHYYADSSGYGWYLMDDEDGNGNLATWEVAGNSYRVSSYMYFWYNYSSSTYNIIYMNKSGSSYEGYGYFWNACIDSWSSYNSFYFYLNN